MRKPCPENEQICDVCLCYSRSRSIAQGARLLGSRRATDNSPGSWLAALSVFHLRIRFRPESVRKRWDKWVAADTCWCADAHIPVRMDEFSCARPSPVTEREDHLPAYRIYRVAGSVEKAARA